eukprot:12398857-Prorocentrum_lima.AAC.1
MLLCRRGGVKLGGNQTWVVQAATQLDEACETELGAPQGMGWGEGMKEARKDTCGRKEYKEWENGGRH